MRGADTGSGSGTDTGDRIANAAGALAKRGLAVIPLWADKTPACKNGLKDAVKGDEERARRMCRGAELLGVVTGEISGIDVLDLDYPRHPEILPLVSKWREQLTGKVRAQRTRSGGEHWLFRHRLGQRNTAGLLLDGKLQRQPGVDRRGDGGYIVWWPTSGFPVLSAAPIDDWPGWLTTELDWKPPLPVSKYERKKLEDMDVPEMERYAQASLDKAIERLARAVPGHRNQDLNNEAYYLSRKFVSLGILDRFELVEALTHCALNMGLTALETGRTLDSAINAGTGARTKAG